MLHEKRLDTWYASESSTKHSKLCARGTFSSGTLQNVHPMTSANLRKSVVLRSVYLALTLVIYANFSLCVPSLDTVVSVQWVPY